MGVIPTVAAVDIPDALHDFRAQYPHVRIDLRVGASDDLVERVSRGDLDVALLGLPATARPRGVRSYELARDQLVAVVAPEHPLAEAREVDLHRLSSEEFVDFPAGTAGRAQSDQAFVAAGIERAVAFEVTAADLLGVPAELLAEHDRRGTTRNLGSGVVRGSATRSPAARRV